MFVLGMVSAPEPDTLLSPASPLQTCVNPTCSAAAGLQTSQVVSSIKLPFLCHGQNILKGSHNTSLTPEALSTMAAR